MFAKRNTQDTVPMTETDADLLECLGAEAWISLPAVYEIEPEDDAADAA